MCWTYYTILPRKTHLCQTCPTRKRRDDSVVLENDILHAKNGQLCVPSRKLKKYPVVKNHDPIWVKYPDRERMLEHLQWKKLFREAKLAI